MNESRIRVIVTGLIAQYPLGGVTWDYLQYILGLARLGHDVYYIEDTGQWPFNPREGGVTKECAFNVDYLAQVMARYGLADRWAYRFPWQSQWFGLSDAARQKVIASADLLINVSSTLFDPSEYRAVRRMAYVDSDPVFTQVKLARGQDDFRRLVDVHDVQFSFGESLGATTPPTGHLWRPTRQPVVLSEWQPSPAHRGAFTTVMNWTSYKPVVYEGTTYGQKDVEFMRFVDLPGQVAPVTLEVAVNHTGKAGQTPVGRLVREGWRVVNPAQVCPDMDAYRSYIQSSAGEWSVAKHGYVLGQPGWFSCRSACYLAAGRPVVVQDTGFSRVLPCGKGVVPFRTPSEAADGIRDVMGNYARHSQAARAIAEEYFASDNVLGRLIEDAFSIPKPAESQGARA